MILSENAFIFLFCAFLIKGANQQEYPVQDFFVIFNLVMSRLLLPKKLQTVKVLAFKDKNRKVSL